MPLLTPDDTVKEPVDRDPSHVARDGSHSTSPVQEVAPAKGSAGKQSGPASLFGGETDRNPVPDLAAISTFAHEALISEEGGPLAVTDWHKAVFLHFAVDPAALQPVVPFELDLWEGQAYVSVVAFSQRHFRLYRGGRASSWLTWPVANFRFCNLRTYVRHGGEAGVYFLVEWITNAPSVILARGVYGLPYRFVRSRYDHNTAAGLFTGEVSAGGRRLVAKARITYDAATGPTAPGSLGEFCLERYVAFTAARGRPLRLLIWHPPWQQQRIEAEIVDDSLLQQSGDWYPHAQLALATYSPGMEGIWIGRPHRVTA